MVFKWWHGLQTRASEVHSSYVLRTPTINHGVNHIPPPGGSHPKSACGCIILFQFSYIAQVARSGDM